MTAFADRSSAGRALAAALAAHRDRDDVVVLGLPRGGVAVAAEVAEALHAPLDVMPVRKLGAPGQPELAIGAIAPGGVIAINDTILSATASAAEVQAEISLQRAELNSRESRYRDGRPPLALAGRRIILVDDGVATGATMLAAIRAVRKQGAQRVVVAIPVASMEALDALREETDEVVCLLTPPHFSAVGEWYRNFEQTTDAEVAALLSRARARGDGRQSRVGSTSTVTSNQT